MTVKEKMEKIKKDGFAKSRFYSDLTVGLFQRDVFLKVVGGVGPL